MQILAVNKHNFDTFMQFLKSYSIRYDVMTNPVYWNFKIEFSVYEKRAFVYSRCVKCAVEFVNNSICSNDRFTNLLLDSVALCIHYCTLKRFSQYEYPRIRTIFCMCVKCSRRVYL